jgi:hypothetical protein
LYTAGSNFLVLVLVLVLVLRPRLTVSIAETLRSGDAERDTGSE